VDLAAQLFLEGIPRKEIAQILETDYSSICKRLQRRGMSKRKELEVREHTRKKRLRTDHTFHAFI
jgi:uncharacterized protein YjcR